MLYPWYAGMGPLPPKELPVLLNTPMGPVNISWGWVSESKQEKFYVWLIKMINRERKIRETSKG